MTRVLDHPLSDAVGGATACVAAVAATLGLAACGSSARAENAVSAAPPINSPCEQVAAVLSDGPDPDADPVGYAQAQVRQLRLLKLSKPALARPVAELANADAAFSHAGGHADATEVTTAEKAVDAICPGAAN